MPMCLICISCIGFKSNISGINRVLVELGEMSECGHVAAETQARDHADAGWSGYRVLADFFAAVDVADVDFDHGQIAAGDGIAQGEACVGERAGVDDQAEDLGIGVFTNLVDNKALVVALVELHFDAERFGFLGQEVFQIGQCFVPINLRLA
jgi:hypothetical protein